MAVSGVAGGVAEGIAIEGKGVAVGGAGVTCGIGISEVVSGSRGGASVFTGGLSGGSVGRTVGPGDSGVAATGEEASRAGVADAVAETSGSANPLSSSSALAVARSMAPLAGKLCRC